MTVNIRNDVPVCGVNIRDLYNTEVRFHNACNTNEIAIFKNQNLPFEFYRALWTDTSSLPANIEEGVEFEGRISADYHTFNSAYTTPNSRFIYEITVPDGVTLSDIQWVYGRFPNASSSLAANATRDGNKITIVSPNQNFGYVTFKSEYACQANNSNVQIGYKVHYVADYVNHPDCLSVGENLICGTKDLLVVGCAVDCPNGGPATGIPVVERLDNSLGWTDGTMTTLQTRDNISKYDLSRSLYKDEFKVETTATQNGNATNLGARLVVGKDKDGNDGLEGISADVVITRGGIQVGQLTGITTYTLDNSTTTDHVFDWDLTEAIPTGGLLDGDKIKITTKYRVISENYPTVDENVGKKWTVYNSDSSAGTAVWEGNLKYCLELIPEIYIVGTIPVSNTNLWRLQACESTDLGDKLAYLARRYSTGAIKYATEYRPGMKIKKMYLELPNSVDFNSAKYIRLNPAENEISIIPTSTTDMGGYTLYTFEIPENSSHFDIPVANAYGGAFSINVTANCSTSDANPYDRIKFYADYVDYYYYAKKQSTIPAELNISKGLGKDGPVAYTKKPSVNMVNQTGNVQLSGQDGEWIVRFTNPSQSTAPYTWMALPDVADLTITKVVRVSDGQVIAPIAYTGGNMYQLSTDGVTSGGSEDYKVKFSYTGCAPISLEAKGGWNCSSFPNTPNEYICNANAISLPATPLKSLLEVSQVTVPSMNPRPELCTELEYVYQLQSSDEANLYNPKFKIAPATGLAIAGDVQVEYPTGSGIWHTITPTPVLSGGEYVIDVMQHPTLAALGYLKGVEESNGNNSLRQVNIKFKTTTNCDFTSGKNFKLRGEAENACGLFVNGSDVPKSTPAILINGADAPYLFTSTVLIENQASSNTVCKSARKISVRETVNAASGVVTGANGKFEFTLPYGYDYDNGSFVGGSNAPEISSLAETTLPTGEKVITFDVPANLGNGAVVEFYFNIVESTSTSPVCGQLTLEFNAIDQIAGLSCGGTTCNNFSVVTGGEILEFELEKPVPANIVITQFNSKKVNGTFDLTGVNTSDAGLILEAVCAADNSVVLGSATISGPIAVGNNIAYEIELIPEYANSSCANNEILVQIKRNTVAGDVQCICEDAQSNKVGFATIGGSLFEDVNGDGASTPTAGIDTPIANVDVIITPTDSTVDLGNGPGQPVTVTTDADGNYVLNVPAGSYDIAVDTSDSDFPADLVNSIDPDGGNDATSNVTVATGDSNLDQNFGFTVCAVAPNMGTTDKVTKVGISTLNRDIKEEWTVNAKQGFIKLESETLGFVPNRLTTAQRDALTNPEEGMLIWNITTQCMEFYNGSAWVCSKSKCSK